MAKLHFYYSAMNAGKTTTLLQSAYNYQERGMRALLFTPIIDNRYGVGVIASRVGLKADAIPFDNAFNFYDHVKSLMSDSIPPKCILVDEAHFLPKSQVLQLSDIASDLNIPVLAYGLRSDFKGEPFEGSKYLLAWAQELNEIKTICHCGRKATMNARIDKGGNIVTEGSLVQIGGNDLYVSLCHKHYKEGRTQ